MKIDSSILDDGRVRYISATMRGRFLILAVSANGDGELPDIHTVTANWGLRKVDCASRVLADLRAVGLLVERNGTLWIALESLRVRDFESARRKIPNDVRAEVLAAGLCANCGATDDLSVDHIRPVAVGGNNDILNLQCLCLPCNRRKGVRVGNDTRL